MAPKPKEVDRRSTAYQSHEEAAGFAGMPAIDRGHFDPKKSNQTVALAPDEVVAVAAIVVLDNP